MANDTAVNKPATNLPGTNISACIVPYTSADKYATHDEKYGRGGYRTVASIEERNSIPVGRRALGMLVNVVGSGIYKLVNNPVGEDSVTTDKDWAGFDSVDVVDAAPTKDEGNQITLTDGALTRTVITDDLPSYIIKTYLTANSDYAKLRWCLVVKNIKPTVDYVVGTKSGGTTDAVLLWHDKDDDQMYYNTTRVYEFETWDHGETWLGSSKLYKNSTSDEPREVITRSKLNSAMSWETL